MTTKSSRKHHRADGTLRPAYRRYQMKRNRERRELRDQEPERAAWLAQFADGARAEFFSRADSYQAIWRRAFSEERSVTEEEGAVLLRAEAEERGWLILETADGVAVGIAPRKQPRWERTKLGENRLAILTLAAVTPVSLPDLYAAVTASREMTPRKFGKLVRWLRAKRLLVNRDGMVFVTETGNAIAEMNPRSKGERPE